MGATHEDVQIADDVARTYLHGYQVDLLNEYDEKVNVMEPKLKELGYEVVFRYSNIYKDANGIENIVTKTPNPIDDGEWIVISVEDYVKCFKNNQTR